MLPRPVSVPQNRWYSNSESGSQFGAFSESLGYADATIAVQPTAVSVIVGEAAAFSVAASGTAPLTYQWYKDVGAGPVLIPLATASTYPIAVTVLGDVGNYSVVIVNASGSATSSAVALAVSAIDADLFKIVRLTANNVVTVDPGNIAGDDRGGLVVTDQKVFLRGDEAVGSFNLDLTGGVQLTNPLVTPAGRLAHDSLVSDLRSQKAYLLANGTAPLGILGGTVTRLVEINSTTGLPNGTAVTLDASIVMPGTGLYNAEVGIFSGWGRIVLHNGTRAYSINPASGAVTDLGAMARPTRVNSESWAYWGVAEYFGGSHYLVYARDSQSIVRTRLPDGATTVISSFANLNDLANLTVVPGLNRWYFRNESINQFSTAINFGSEILGYADAAFLFRPASLVVTLATGTVTVLEDAGLRSTPGFVTGSPATTESYSLTSDNAALFSAPPALAANGTLIFTPAANANGSAVITVVGLDSSAAPTGSGTFTITVTPVNDAPSFALAAPTVTVLEDSGAQTVATYATSISAGPAGEASQVVTFTVTNDADALFLVQPALSTAGTLTFIPALNAYGSATVTVIAQDDGGTANGGVDTSAPQTFTITVSPLATRVFLSGATPTGRQGETLVVPILLKAVGTENAVGFTLNFDTSKLTYAGTALGANSTGASVLENAVSAASGRVGFVLTRGASGGAFSAGTNEVVLVSFTVSPTATVGPTPVTFTDVTARREVTDASATVIATAFVDGSVTIASAVAGTASNYEGDVAPRPYGTGNGSVTVADAVLIGRFAAGLDTANTANGEFQRADCAPLGSKGDGRVTVADWVQALRFASALDTPGAVGGPTGLEAVALRASAVLSAGNRTLRVAGGSLVAGRANTVTVQLDAQGNEAGLQFSLGFDPAALTFVSASAGSGAPGATVVANTQRAGLGRVGLLVVMPAGSSVAAGTRDVLTLTFTVNGAGSTAVTVLNHTAASPREVADVNANPVGATYVGGSFNILLPAGLKAAGMERAADGSLHLVVRNTDGTPVTAAQAARYAVHVTSNLGGVWTLLPNALVVENGALKIVDPAANGAGLRLYKLVEMP